MPRSARFALLLVVGLAVLTWLAYVVVDGATREWFETDVALRARLVASSAGDALVSRESRGDEAGVELLLTGITRDDRIMAAALCDDGAAPRRVTVLYPSGA